MALKFITPSLPFIESVVKGTSKAQMVTPLHEEHIITNAFPHKIYTLSLEDIVKTKGVGFARLIGWRIFHDTDRTVVVESYCNEQDRDHKFGGINRGRLVEGSLYAISVAEKHPYVAKQDFEVRLVRLHALLIDALWLYDKLDRKHLLIPIATNIKGISLDQAYPANGFLAELQGMASQIPSKYPI